MTQRSTWYTRSSGLPRGGNAPSILIVEDDDNLGPGLAEIFGYMNVRSRVVADGTGVLDAVATMRPALVLLDLHLPGRSGVAVMRELRAVPHLASTKVLVISADVTCPRQVAGLADAVLLKPFTIDELTGAIGRLVPAFASLGRQRSAS